MAMSHKPLHNAVRSEGIRVGPQTVAVVLQLEACDRVHHVEPNLMDGELHLILQVICDSPTITCDGHMILTQNHVTVICFSHC